MSRGIDISHNNGAINWSAVKDAGIEFAIVRAGYGQIEDRNFKGNIEGAAGVGLPVGIYYFSYALGAADAEKEAAHCCGLLQAYEIDLPVFFDFEYASEQFGARYGVTYTRELRTAITKAFCERVRAGGYTPGIYTNVDYITSRLNWGELACYPLWLAQWPHGTRFISFGDVDEKSVNTKYGKPVIWQIGCGKVSGILTDTDLNYAYIPLPAKTLPHRPDACLKPGDKVRVINTTTAGGVRRAKLYGSNKTFVVYYDCYDVISASGNRIIIGKGKVVTAAVDAGDLQKVR